MSKKITPEHSALVTLLLASMTNVNFATRKLTEKKALGGTAKRKLNLLHSQGEELYYQLQQIEGYDNEAADSINVLSNVICNVSALLLQCDKNDITDCLNLLNERVNGHRQRNGLPPMDVDTLIPDAAGDLLPADAAGRIVEIQMPDEPEGPTPADLGFQKSIVYDEHGGEIELYSKPFPLFENPSVPQEGLTSAKWVPGEQLFPGLDSDK